MFFFFKFFLTSSRPNPAPLRHFLPCVRLGIVNQLGPESMERLRHYAENMQGGAGQGAGAADDDEDDEEDEDVPSLVENFEVIQCTVSTRNFLSPDDPESNFEVILQNISHSVYFQQACSIPN